MYKFLPYMTNDYSVGLYDENVNDICHSAFGAVTEAYEKFVCNSLSVLKEKENLSVLDICYGIGYNTKVLINENFKLNKRLEIDCVDTNNYLIELSPFIQNKINLFNRIKYNKLLYKNIKNYDEGNKIVSFKKTKNNYIISKKVNYIIYSNLIKNYKKHFLSKKSKFILSEKDNYPFFDKTMINFNKKIAKIGVYLYLKRNKSTFVHNIYYKYVSSRYNALINKHNSNNVNINFHTMDVRNFIRQTNNMYDIIYLDGFTPSKCPCIWSVEFFKTLYRHTNDNGIVLTYNMSAPVRNAMKIAGFFIGNIIDKKTKIIGTICSKNKWLIKYSLSEAQEGLLNTKAGIPYRDYDLSLDNAKIIEGRKLEVDNSNLQSSSQYMKAHK